MNKLLSAFSDGSEGMPLSMTRVMVCFLIVAVVGTKYYNSWLTKTPILWDNQDFTMIGGALGVKLFQNSQESTTPNPINK